MRNPSHIKPRPGGARAFTIVELLVVISIISLLITILVPSLTQVKVRARVVRTSATISTAAKGLEMYRSEQALGEVYPPSRWDTSAAGANGGNPYQATGQTTTTQDPFIACGAQTLLWGLVGADLLGTTGFKQNLQTAYALDATTKKPVQSRFGPYIDITNFRTGKPANFLTTAYSSKADSNAPVILDDFDNPILYYKARKDRNKSGVAEYYSYDDNFPLTGTVSPAHPLHIDPPPAFDKFVKNFKVTVRDMPFNSDTYLLLSPGPDGLYGNQDDVANFPFTAENF